MAVGIEYWFYLMPEGKLSIVYMQNNGKYNKNTQMGKQWFENWSKFFLFTLVQWPFRLVFPFMVFCFLLGIRWDSSKIKKKLKSKLHVHYHNLKTYYLIIWKVQNLCVCKISKVPLLLWAQFWTTCCVIHSKYKLQW